MPENWSENNPGGSGFLRCQISGKSRQPFRQGLRTEETYGDLSVGNPLLLRPEAGCARFRGTLAIACLPFRTFLHQGVQNGNENQCDER